MLQRGGIVKLADKVNGRLRRVPAWLLYIIAIVPPVWLFYRGVIGDLGIEPIKELEHRIGELGLQVLIIGLAVTPLRRFAGLNLLKFRRAIGLIGFFYIFLHLLVWLFLDVQFWSQIWADILKRPYITIGMTGFALLIPLAITSNNLSIRRMGAASWRRLHRLVYGAVLLGGVHYVMLGKVWVPEALLYLGVICMLLALRLPKFRQRIAA